MAEIYPFPVDRVRRTVVLIVDDEPAIRAVLSEFLRGCGFRALAVESGDAAVRLIQRGIAIDLVFSDIRMPGELDGYGLARWIGEHRPGLPVLLATGDLGKVRALAELEIETLAKPYDFETAAARMRQTIRHHHRISA